MSPAQFDPAAERAHESLQVVFLRVSIAAGLKCMRKEQYLGVENSRLQKQACGTKGTLSAQFGLQMRNELWAALLRGGRPDCSRLIKGRRTARLNEGEQSLRTVLVSPWGQEQR